jgi:pimeloyl-ACP methyl ester carboxylesterase
MRRSPDAGVLAARHDGEHPRESSREEEKSMTHRAILLPGIVLPAELAYPALIEALGEGVEARAKELEVYASDPPGPDYGIETELAGLVREAEVAGFERFHLVGYSGGGAISAAFAARYPGRLLSLSLLEPAWVGNEGRSERELLVQAEFDRTWELPEEKLMRRSRVAAGAMIPCRPSWWAARPMRWQGSHGPLSASRSSATASRCSLTRRSSRFVTSTSTVNKRLGPTSSGAHPFHTVHEGAVGLDDDAGFGTAEVRARCRREAHGSGAW